MSTSSGTRRRFGKRAGTQRRAASSGTMVRREVQLTENTSESLNEAAAAANQSVSMFLDQLIIKALKADQAA